MLAASDLLAHAGGAPEALTIGLPIAVFVGFMLLEKRARRREKTERDGDDPGGEGGS